MIAHTPSPSGLEAVDHQWGGLATSRAYLLVGRAGAGRSALALRTVRAAVEADQRCLVISPRAPEDLVAVGQEVGLDLAKAHGAGRLRLLRIPKAADLAARGPEGLAKSYRDLVALVGSDRPDRVVIEDFTPLVQFDTFERFHEAFLGLVDALREQETTLVIGLGDPANDASRRLLEVVEDLVDGTIRLGADGDLALGTPPHAPYPTNDGASVETDPPSFIEADLGPLAAAEPAISTSTADVAPEPVAEPTPAEEPVAETPSFAAPGDAASEETTPAPPAAEALSFAPPEPTAPSPARLMPAPTPAPQPFPEAPPVPGSFPAALTPPPRPGTAGPAH